MKAFMSYNNLAINNANFNLEGKLATLWFDNLLLGTGKELVEKVMEDVAEKEQWSSDTFKEMKKVQISSETLLPSISFMDESIIEDDYFKDAADVLKDKYAKELSSPKTYGGAMHEIVWEGFGIANSVKYWTLLNAKANCTFLPMDMEQQILEKNTGVLIIRELPDTVKLKETEAEAYSAVWDLMIKLEKSLPMAYIFYGQDSLVEENTRYDEIGIFLPDSLFLKNLERHVKKAEAIIYAEE